MRDLDGDPARAEGALLRVVLLEDLQGLRGDSIEKWLEFWLEKQLEIQISYCLQV